MKKDYGPLIGAMTESIAILEKQNKTASDMVELMKTMRAYNTRRIRIEKNIVKAASLGNIHDLGVYINQRKDLGTLKIII